MQIILAFLGGIIPTIVWLWFWLKEDSKNPEPRKYIATTFIVGMITALLVIYPEKIVLDNMITYSLGAFLLLAFIEEFFKMFFGYFFALKQPFMDEPIDAVIYMITIALGFAATENSLYLWNLLSVGPLTDSGLILINMRFVGATVLHVASSGIVGIAIGLSFFKKKKIKIAYASIGLILSVLLHTTFNFLIMNSESKNILYIFIFIWVVTITLFLFIEKIKKINPLKK